MNADRIAAISLRIADVLAKEGFIIEPDPAFLDRERFAGAHVITTGEVNAVVSHDINRDCDVVRFWALTTMEITANA